MNGIHSMTDSYKDSSFILQLRAKTLSYFLIICSGFVVLFLVLHNVIANRPLLSLINIVLVVILGFLTTAIFLWYSGKYYIAANVLVIGTVIALGLRVNFGMMAHNEGFNLTNYQFLVLIAFSTLFC